MGTLRIATSFPPTHSFAELARLHWQQYKVGVFDNPTIDDFRAQLDFHIEEAVRSAGVHWRWSIEWTGAMSELAILFGDRFAASAS